MYGRVREEGQSREDRAGPDRSGRHYWRPGWTMAGWQREQIGMQEGGERMDEGKEGWPISAQQCRMAS